MQIPGPQGKPPESASPAAEDSALLAHGTSDSYSIYTLKAQALEASSFTVSQKLGPATVVRKGRETTAAHRVQG